MYMVGFKAHLQICYETYMSNITWEDVVEQEIVRYA